MAAFGEAGKLKLQPKIEIRCNPKIDFEIKEHLERFDYQDVPDPNRNSTAYNTAMDERRPDWAKAMVGVYEFQRSLGGR